MIQETMIEGDRDEATFKGILKNWEVESLDAVGHSRGLITTWSPTMAKIESRNMESVLETKLKDQETGSAFTFLNIYGPFYDRTSF